MKRMSWSSKAMLAHEHTNANPKQLDEHNDCESDSAKRRKQESKPIKSRLPVIMACETGPPRFASAVSRELLQHRGTHFAILPASRLSLRSSIDEI